MVIETMPESPRWEAVSIVLDLNIRDLLRRRYDTPAVWHGGMTAQRKEELLQEVFGVTPI
jgi:hypothetical protein